MEEAIKAYPDLPVTVGPIAADLDEDWSGDTQAQVVARELFELPQVEMAHHTFSHPFQWGFFEDYSQNREASFVRLYNDPSVQAWGVEVVKGPIAQTVTLKEAYNQPAGSAVFPSKWSANSAEPQTLSISMPRPARRWRWCSGLGTPRRRNV